MIVVEIYSRKPRVLLGRPQQWRWRAKDAGNSRILAASSEAYTNLADVEHAVALVFGDLTTAVLRTKHGDHLLRTAREP